MTQGLTVVQRTRPFSPPKAFQEALVCHEQRRLREAEQLYNTVLKADGRHLGALYRLGLLCLQQGRYNDAAQQFRRAIRVDQNSSDAHHMLALALTRLDRHDQAIAHYRKVVAISPGSAEAHNNLGNTLQRLGRSEQAVAHFHQALEIRSSFPEAHYNLANALRALDRTEEAITHYRKAIEIRPLYAKAHNNLGLTLQALGRFDMAITHFEQALAIKPNYSPAHYNLGNAQHALGRSEEAITHLRKALAIDPKDAEAHNSLGIVLHTLGRGKEAICCYQKAVAINPRYAEAHNNLGTALRTLGRLDEALHAVGKAIALAPKKAAYYLSVVDTKRLGRDDRYFRRMTELALDVSSLPIKEQIALHFALGKALAEVGDHAQSFEHLLKGNALVRKQINYDESEELAQLDRIRRVFNAELMRERQGQGHASSLPIFIVGMPRSGTTLVEQILASHPKVFGAGELRTMTNLAKNLSASEGTSFPEAVAAVPAEQIRRVGESYERAVGRLAPEAERVTDKMPANFHFAGLIHLALPDARIIHVRRDLRDTALSCFSLWFAEGQEFSYDLAELGRYCRAYQMLMEHWRNLLPKEVMLEVDYEDVVDNLERQARRIVYHCSLEWDDACLAFYRSQRPVQTASTTQVRRPIYRTSVGRWRQYQDVLQPLLRALDD
jgi:tetratricopeptide (TPR) repeat protein